MGIIKIKHLALYVFLAIVSPFFIPSNAHGGIDIDLTLPVGFKSISPAQFSIVRDDHFVLKGKLMGDFRISSVSIKGTEARIDDENGFEFSDIQMKEGLNTFLISLTDVNGRRRLVSYSVYSEPRGPMAGGGRIANGPVVDVGAAEGYTAPPRKKLSTRIERRTEKPKPPASNKNLDVVFSSPYSGQIITEKELKTGGRFNKDAGITSITVNGQLCELNQATGTFEGPTLICPGKAREYNVNADSPKYILMRVDPKTHSGENILKVKVTPAEGKPYEDRLVYYYYQLFVKSETEGKLFVPIVGAGGSATETEYAVPKSEMFNPDLYYEAPFGGWGDMKSNSRIFYPEFPHYPYYGDYKIGYVYGQSPPFYSVRDAPWLSYMSLINIGIWNSTDGSREWSDTIVTLHSPPSSVKTYTILLKNCQFIETDYMALNEHEAVESFNPANYLVNGCRLNPLLKKTDDMPYGKVTYVTLENEIPDRDFRMEVTATNYSKNPVPQSFGLLAKLFSCEIDDGFKGDILVDSNNDGYLGGDDNAVEQNAPGCVFWVNDDDDYDELTKVHSDDSKAVNSNGNDSADDNINGIRDLEDFMPINIAIPNIQEWSNSLKGVKFFLKAEGSGRIKIYKRVTDLEKYKYLTYLKDLNSSIEQYKQTCLINLTTGDKNMQELKSVYFDDSGSFHAIFEGIEAGQLKLNLVAAIIDERSGKVKDEILLDEAYVTLKDVREMYMLANVRKNLEITGNIYSTEDDTIFIWTHGYNTSIRDNGQKIDSRTDSFVVIDTVYKRMYRTGFRGPFIGITWHGDEGTVMAFNANWENSFRAAQKVADLIKDTRMKYPDAKINISAHSLGNNVLCYALRSLAVQTQTKIDNLILGEAAIPGEAFSGYRYTPRYDILGIRRDFFDNMYGRSIDSIRGRVYNTYSTADEILGGSFRANHFLSKLPTPLDDRYNLVNYNTVTAGRPIDALGLNDAYSKYINHNKYKNEPFYPPDDDSEKNKRSRPYWIRKHGSMMDEYYYDVQDFYYYLIYQKKIKDKK